MEEKNIRVLCVDNNIEMYEILKNYFEITGGIELCGVAIDGISALEKIKEMEPDVVLLDIIMPKLDGISVLEYLKSNPPKKMPFVIVISAIWQDMITQKALSLGAGYYMIKPFDLFTLVNRIKLITKQDPTHSEIEMSSENNKLENIISRELISLGAKTSVIGYKYIIDAIMLIINDNISSGIAKQVYASISKKSNTTIQCVESAIRKCIDKIFCLKTQNFILLMEMSGIDLSKRPSNAQFITVIAERIKIQNNF